MSIPAQPALTIDGEVVVALADGRSLRTGVYDADASDAHLCGEYVRLVDADGEEISYWDQEEWAADPAAVMGAILSAATSTAP